MNNAQKLLKKIQKENITQTSRWYFIFKNIFFWVIGILFIVLGSIAVSIIIDTVLDTEADILQSIMHSRIEFYISLIPFFWIFFVLLFLGFSYFGMSHTKKGYKYNPLHIVGGSILISIILGIGCHFAGYSEKAEHFVARHVSFYHGNEEMKKNHWVHPQEGFLSGEIIEISEKNTLVLQDWKGVKWDILYTEKSLIKNSSHKKGKYFENHKNNTSYHKKNFVPATLQKGEKIKIRGKVDTENNRKFFAERIMGW